LDGVLNRLYAGRQEPITIIVHLACPRISYTDRGKGSLVLTGEITEKEPPAPPPQPQEIPPPPEPPPAKPLVADKDGILRIEPRGSLKVSNEFFEKAKQVLLGKDPEAYDYHCEIQRMAAENAAFAGEDGTDE